MLVNHYNELLLLGYMDPDFKSNRDSRKSIYKFVFTLGGGVVSWRSMKQLVLLTPLWKSSMLLLLK